MMRFFGPALPFLALALSACGGGNYPSLLTRPGETPRTIEAPGAGVTPALRAAEAQKLEQELKTEEQAFVAAQKDTAAAATELRKTLAATGRAKVGTPPWSAAQTVLSRFDIAREAFAGMAARLAILGQPTVDLPESDPLRQRFIALQSAVDNAIAVNRARSRQAMQQLTQP